MFRNPNSPARVRRLAGAVALAGTVALGCSPASESEKPKASAPSSTPKAEKAPETAAEVPTGQQLVTRGKRVYAANCIACHNPDPTQTGGLGPAVAGSSYELLEARVLRGEYPEGYTPKVETRVMIPLPHLENDIAALEAFLNPEAG